MKGHNDPHCLKCVAWNFPHHKKSWKGLSSEWERNLNYPPPSGAVPPHTCPFADDYRHACSSSFADVARSTHSESDGTGQGNTSC